VQDKPEPHTPAPLYIALRQTGCVAPGVHAVPAGIRQLTVVSQEHMAPP
jgi:hypothetical protein